MMVRLQFCRSGEFEIWLYCYYSQVDPDLKPLYLLESTVSVKYICLKIIRIRWNSVQNPFKKQVQENSNINVELTCFPNLYS